MVQQSVFLWKQPSFFQRQNYDLFGNMKMVNGEILKVKAIENSLEIST